jgi:hypothetical protein
MLGESIADGTLGGAMFRTGRAQLALARGHADEAVRWATLAATEAEKATGDPEHPVTGAARLVLGQAQAAMGDARTARGTLEQALAQARHREDKADSLAEHEFRLAEALWSMPTERKRALSLADEATMLLATLPKSTLTSQLQDEIAAWTRARSSK